MLHPFAHVKDMDEAVCPTRNDDREEDYLDLLRLVDALLIIADVKVIFHVEEFVDVLLLTCHLVTVWRFRHGLVLFLASHIREKSLVPGSIRDLERKLTRGRYNTDYGWIPQHGADLAGVLIFNKANMYYEFLLIEYSHDRGMHTNCASLKNLWRKWPHDASINELLS